MDNYSVQLQCMSDEAVIYPHVRIKITIKERSLWIGYSDSRCSFEQFNYSSNGQGEVFDLYRDISVREFIKAYCKVPWRIANVNLPANFKRALLHVLNKYVGDEGRNM